MPRPRIRRRIRFNPDVTYFKPAGIGVKELEVVELGLDEFEALRLSDAEDINQEDAAKRMEISQPTFHRILSTARKKVASSLVNGQAIKIDSSVKVRERRD
ncbi:DUF134 domain-containing protein [Candidatus Undinarchaeota archaeon]